MDRLSFCREYLNKLNEEDLLRIYNLLAQEYDDGEYIFINDIKYFPEILEMMDDWGWNIEDWRESLDNGSYNPQLRYICINENGISSIDKLGAILWFVDKNLNGEAMGLVEEYLNDKGIINS